MARQLCLEGFLEQILSSLDLGEGSEQERAWLDSAGRRLKALKTMPEACEMLQWVALRSKHVSQGVSSSDS